MQRRTHEKKISREQTRDERESYVHGHTDARTLNVGNYLYIACARRHKMSSTSSYTNFGRMSLQACASYLPIDVS